MGCIDSILLLLCIDCVQSILKLSELSISTLLDLRSEFYETYALQEIV